MIAIIPYGPKLIRRQITCKKSLEFTQGTVILKRGHANGPIASFESGSMCGWCIWCLTFPPNRFFKRSSNGSSGQ